MNPTSFSSTSQASVDNDPQEAAVRADTDLFTRHSGNPILSRQDWPYPVNSVFNAGVTRLADGETLLRVEDRTGLSHLCAARSANGIDGWRVDAQPTLMGSPQDYPEEIWGIEDPRITYVPELEQYAIAYTSFAHGGPGVSLALTKDFRSFERYGVIMQPEDRDAALFAAKDRRPMGYDSSPDDNARRSYVDLVLPRPAALGQSQSNAGGATVLKLHTSARETILTAVRETGTALSCCSLVVRNKPGCKLAEAGALRLISQWQLILMLLSMVRRM